MRVANGHAKSSKILIRIIMLGCCVVAFTALLMILWEFWLEPMLIAGHETISEKWSFIRDAVDAVMVALIPSLIYLNKSDRKLAIAIDELEKTRDSLREAQRIAHLGHCEWTIGEDKILWSEECSNILTGSPATRVASFPIFLNAIHPDDRANVQESVEKSLQKRTAGEIEFRVCYADGAERDVIGRWEVKTNVRTGEPSIFIATIQDITERKQFERSLAKSMHDLEEKEIAQIRFLAAAGHDLRQPLAAYNLFIGALKYTEPTAKQKEIILHLDQTMTNFNDLLDALQNVSKLDAGVTRPEYTAINVPELFSWIGQSFEALYKEKKLEFRLHVTNKNIFVVRSDINLLKAVLRNLVSNALKFTSRGGVLVSARQRGSEVLFQVWDTGIGIAGEDIRKMFDEFWQANNPQRDRVMGIGLGLSIVKRTLLLLDSEITCHSKIGRGSVFGFRLPLVETLSDVACIGHVENLQEDVSLDTLVRSKRFVVVEDDKLVASALIQSLQVMGGEVKCYYNAEDALVDADIENTDYFIVDYMLGGTHNGIQFLNQLGQRQGKYIDAVLLTGDTSPDFARIAANCDWPILYKPTNITELITTLWKNKEKGVVK